MIRLFCEWDEPLPGPGPTGLDLGHMTFIGDKGSCTSKNKIPSQSMMLFISFAQLLYGLEQLATRKLLEYMFVGADAGSFIVKFRATWGRRVTVRCQDVLIDEVDIIDLCRSILSDVQEFIARPENQLPEDDPGREDMSIAITDLTQAIGGSEAK